MRTPAEVVADASCAVMREQGERIRLLEAELQVAQEAAREANERAGEQGLRIEQLARQVLVLNDKLRLAQVEIGTWLDRLQAAHALLGVEGASRG